MSRGGHIRDDEAWNRGREAAIKRNAAVGRRARWLIEDPSRNALVTQIMSAADRSQFMRKMLDALTEWGSLTAGQEAAVKRIFEQDAERMKERTARNAGCVWVGTVGERLIVCGVIEFVHTYETEFGYKSITIIRSDDGNLFVFKGKRIGDKGLQLNVRGTVKSHDERDGVKQTRLQRPKVL